MRAVVIGYGSIGARHTRILNELGCKVSVVSHREIKYPIRYKNVSDALQKDHPDYIVIANKTTDHYDTLKELADLDFSGIVLVEKPLFAEKAAIPANNFKEVFVAYNLRFHPIIQKLYKLLNDEKIISLQAYVGQYLPNWRPQIDYTLNYSASRSQGGGVLLDLSHELDYLNWIAGDWESLTALGGHYSSLEIDSDDVFALLIQTAKSPVICVQMNYLDRQTRREIIINTDKNTYKADLVNGLFDINGEQEKFQIERDYTYKMQHLAIINSNYEDLCRINSGLTVMEIIEAAEKSVSQKVWVLNEKDMHNMC